MSETAMMAANRYRLRHQAQEGHRGAKLAVALLGKTDKLLGVILLGNTLSNVAAATLTGYIALEIFGTEKWALEAGTLFVTFALLIISEITPKVVGATYADRITPTISYALAPLLKLLQPIVWFLNLFVGGLLRAFRLTPSATHQAPRMSPEELRTLVLEGGNFIPQKHQSILLNLFDLEAITVEDMMTPRASIEAIDLAAPWEDVMTRLSTCYHTRLPVYREDPGSIIGILHMRRVIAPLRRGELSIPEIEAQIQAPYYIPARTPVFTQLQFFQENRQRIGLVVDEYGEVLGLVTLEDLLEEVVGEIVDETDITEELIKRIGKNQILVHGRTEVRKVNDFLKVDLGDDAVTISGLVQHELGRIPKVGEEVHIANCRLVIHEADPRVIKSVQIYKEDKHPTLHDQQVEEHVPVTQASPER